MIIYTCPECGADLRQTMLISSPPRRKFYCDACGWQHLEEQEWHEETIRIPYGGNRKNFNFNTPDLLSYKAYDFSDACEYCPNDPRNGGPGNCNCILGIPKITC